MPRPIKEGLDYFPLDVNLDDKIYMVECEMGLTGFALLIKLFIKIYKNGYYINWNEKIAKMFARQNNTEVNVINELLDVCINEEIINKDLYDKYNILTSRGIQKRYLEAVKRRKEITLIKKYMLVETVDKSINVNINWIDVNNNSINDDDNKQSKVKKSKEEKSKESSLSESSPAQPKNDTSYKATCYLIDKILANNRRTRVPNKDPTNSLMKKWVREMERLHRLGPVGALESENKGYSWEEIKKIINWSQDDHFWKSNIRSTAKLREKIVTLEDKMKISKPKISMEESLRRMEEGDG